MVHYHLLRRSFSESEGFSFLTGGAGGIIWEVPVGICEGTDLSYRIDCISTLEIVYPLKKLLEKVYEEVLLEIFEVPSWRNIMDHGDKIDLNSISTLEVNNGCIFTSLFSVLIKKRKEKIGSFFLLLFSIRQAVRL